MTANSLANHSTRLVFVKFGGSLITDKHQANTSRLDVIRRLAEELSASLQSDPNLRLLVGNGAGSFGHIPARKYDTREGVATRKEWLGFSEVWHEAAALNRIVIDVMRAAGLPAIAFPPSAAITTRDSQIVAWNIYPIESALRSGLIPVVHGDVIFDQKIGGTILSTEDLFGHLAHQFHPQQILLAGIEAGVWEDYPECTKLIQEITPMNFQTVIGRLQGSSAVDVTGGMASKVMQSLDLVSNNVVKDIIILSGMYPGNLLNALLGAKIGTRVWNPPSDDPDSQI